MDIIIYTTLEKLDHKKGGDGYSTYYWYLSRPPKNFKVGERIYFAVKGNVVGSFKCKEFNTEKGKYGKPEDTIVWDADSWKEISHIPTKSFQGFKYKWWE